MPPIANVKIRPFRPSDESAVVALWERCGLLRPWNNPQKDIGRKLKVQADLFLVAFLEGELVATVMVGYEGHRGWINYLAVAPDLQRKGLGRLMMSEAEKRLREQGCPKINLQVRTSNRGAIAFYERLGYALDDVVSMGKRLEQD